MPTPTYNVDDEVIVRSDIKAGKEYGAVYFTTAMANYIGKKVKISNIQTNYHTSDGHLYQIDQPCNGCVWSVEMFESPYQNEDESKLFDLHISGKLSESMYKSIMKKRGAPSGV